MTITRATIDQRRKAIQLGVIPYSQSTLSPVTRRRADCSGLLSYVWDCPLSGPGLWLAAYSTATFVTQGQIFSIPRAELRPGDAIGYCGPDTAGSGGGHIALWLGKSGTRERIWDHGSGMGPKDRLITWGVGTGWQAAGKIGAWRFVHVQEDDGTTYDGSTPSREETLMFANYGDGGPVVRYLQLRLLGVDPNCLPRFGADSGYGNETAAAVAKYAGGGDGKVYGPDQMNALDKAWDDARDSTGGGVTEARVAEIAEDVAEQEIAGATVTLTPTE